MRLRALTAAATLVLLAATVAAAPIAACGGFFCTTVPVDQAAERVIFTMDGTTVTTYVQINYVGAAEEFAWVLPVPSVPEIATADASTFRDLDRLTQPIYIPPRAPDCLTRNRAMPASAAGSRAETTVLASGEVGPFGYHVVSSPDPMELVRWLRDNGYRITPEMEPLVQAYTDDGLIFLAMKLRQGQAASDIVPVKLTYASSQPMIPLRLTAVAATPDMPVVVWVFANGRVEPTNFAAIRIADSEVSFTPSGRNDYLQVVSRAADQAGGRAFVTEFAGPTTATRPPTDETLKLLVQQYPYLTRLYTRISPEEMTVDPAFDLAPGLGDVSNVHDLSGAPSPWTCSDDPGTWRTVAGSGPPPSIMAGERYLQRAGQGGAPKGLVLFAAVAGTAALVARRRPRPAAFWARGTGGWAGWRGVAESWATRLTPTVTALLFLETVLLQGFHEIEHIVQVAHRSMLGIPTGAGVLGSAFDIEPVHMVYNAAFLVLLGAVYVGCRRNRAAIPARPASVLSLLGLALALQAYHTVEHLAKKWQFFATGLNGTPGILGYLVPVVYLHFTYNTVIYGIVLTAFFLGGCHRAALGALVPPSGRRHLAA